MATRCATEPYSAAPPRRGTGPLPSSDAEASTDRAPRPAVWASTALSSGRVAVRGAGATGGKRGAAGRAGASRGRQPLPTSPREAAGEGSGGHRRRREAREALKSGPGASRYPSGGAGWAQELIQDFKVIHTPDRELDGCVLRVFAHDQSHQSRTSRRSHPACRDVDIEVYCCVRYLYIALLFGALGQQLTALFLVGLWC